jgi:hypothetical protein
MLPVYVFGSILVGFLIFEIFFIWLWLMPEIRVAKEFYKGFGDKYDETTRRR